jgi:pimeloyl-ACP methyl ester carboxylesterase
MTTPSDPSPGTVGLALVHGAELGSWLWDPVLAHLRHPALAIDLPGRRPADVRRRDVTPAAAVDAVCAAVRGRWPARRVVLVLHSFSAGLAPAVAAQLGSQVAAAVLVGGAVAQPGRAWLDDRPWSERLLLRGLYRLRPDGMLSPRRDTERSACADLDAAATTTVLERRVPEAPRLLLDPPPVADLDVPVHAVLLTADRAVPVAVQEGALSRLRSPVVHRFDSGHLPMLARPRELADLLDRIADDA